MDTQLIQEVLQDIHYPITKEELIDEFKKRAPEVVPLIKQELPAQTYNSIEEVASKLPLGNLKGMLGL